MKKKARKAVSKAMREKKHEKDITVLRNCPSGMFTVVRRLIIDSREV